MNTLAELSADPPGTSSSGLVTQSKWRHPGPSSGEEVGRVVQVKTLPCRVGGVLIPLRGPVKARSGGQSRLRVSGAARRIRSGRQMTSSLSYWLFQLWRCRINKITEGVRIHQSHFPECPQMATPPRCQERLRMRLSPPPVGPRGPTGTNASSRHRRPRISRSDPRLQRWPSRAWSLLPHERVDRSARQPISTSSSPDSKNKD